MNTTMEIEIGPGAADESYTVRVLRSAGGGEPNGTFELDVDGILSRRPQLEESVLASSVRARRIMSDREIAIQETGSRLFEAVFQGAVERAYRTSLAVSSERGRGLQLVLRLTSPELAALPWESLYDAETSTYLCRKEPLVRQVPAPYTHDALDFEPPLRILGMVSAPRGLEHLDVEAEQQRLDEALRPHIDEGLVELHWLEDVSWSGVHAALLGGSWHILHFIGHGGYDDDTDEGVLALVGSDGRADFVTAGALADLLAEANPVPRLVVLNSCQSGTGSTSDLFSGTAAALVHNGMHAVAAMQFAVTDTAAVAFARAFYTALAYGRGIDEAMRSGRIGMLGTGRGTLEWVTPVLYLRGNDTQLFELTRPVRTLEAPATRGTESDEPDAAEAAVAAVAGVAAVAEVDEVADVADVAEVPPEGPDSTSEPTIDEGLPNAAPARSTVDDTRESATPTPVAPSAPPPVPTEPLDDVAPPPAEPSTATPPPPVAPPPTEPSAAIPQPPAEPSTAIPSAPAGPSGPPLPPEPGPPAPPSESRRSAWRLWLIIGIVVVVAIAAGATAWVVSLQARPAAVGPASTATPEPSTTPPVETAATVQPVVVTVPGTARWTDTGFVCVSGDAYIVLATGNVSFEGDTTGGVGPDGAAPRADGTFDPGGNVPGLENAPHRGLIGSVDGANLFFIGSEATIACPSDGKLQLGVNDVGIDDNTGEFVATVKPRPTG